MGRYFPNATSLSCTPCPFDCLTCDSAGLLCLSCDVTGDHRLLNSSSGRC
jgi:hypothetical protein